MFFNIRYDNEFVDNGVGWFGGNNIWFRDVNVMVCFVVLFCMVDGGVFYWIFYCFRFIFCVNIYVV